VVEWFDPWGEAYSKSIAFSLYQYHNQSSSVGSLPNLIIPREVLRFRETFLGLERERDCDLFFLECDLDLDWLRLVFFGIVRCLCIIVYFLFFFGDTDAEHTSP
jgi:hypothetical protein